MPKALNGTVEIHWESHGEGEPVLMIMGLITSSRGWQRLLPHISKHYRAIVFDNRGTGQSGGGDGFFGMSEMVEDAIAVMDAAGVSTAHVLGASMGGMIAQNLVLNHSQRAGSLILGCSQASYTPFGGRSVRTTLGMALRPVVGHKRAFSALAPALYSQRTLLDHRDRVGEDLRFRMADVVSNRTAYSQLLAVMRHDTRERLHEIEQPTLVVHGEEDGLVSVDAAGYLADVITNAELRILRDCAHIITTDAELEASAAMIEFLQRQPKVTVSRRHELVTV